MTVLPSLWLADRSRNMAEITEAQKAESAYCVPSTQMLVKGAGPPQAIFARESLVSSLASDMVSA